MKADPRAVYNRLVAAGLTHVQACGVLGNIQQESGFNTDVLGFDGTGSVGLCQWLGPRKRQLQEFARRRGEPYTDWEVQTDFIMRELRTTEKVAMAKLQATTSAASAALVFSRFYERPHQNYAHNDKRMAYAARFANEFS